MPKVGCFPGKFLPPHRGHLNSIIRAGTQVDKLYVVVSDRKADTERMCKEHSLRPMPALLRAKWLSIELQNLNHIRVIILDEGDIPSYPHGVKEWAEKLHSIIPEHIDMMFTADTEYEKTFGPYHTGTIYNFFDSNREKWPISATEIRENPRAHWDYILGSARSNFTKRVLITGTESCGKTTLTKSLAKIFLTSWSEELGRYYSEKHLGGNESLFTDEDFVNIACDQLRQDAHALKTSNRVTFFDTDAVVTQFYAKMYLGHPVLEIEKLVTPDKYDVVIMMEPSVRWVEDGLRFNPDQEKRNALHQELKEMYLSRGFKNIVYISDDNYTDRLDKVIDIVEKLI